MNGYNETQAQLTEIRRSIRHAQISARDISESELTQHGKEAGLDERASQTGDSTIFAILKRVNQIFMLDQQVSSSLMTTIEILSNLQKQMNDLESKVAALQETVDSESTAVTLAVQAVTDAATVVLGLKAELDQVLAAVSESAPQITGLDVKFGTPTQQSKVVSLKPSDEVKN